jgi:hypothetical protein
LTSQLPPRIQPWPLSLEEWLKYNTDDLLGQIQSVPAGKDYPLSFRWVTAEGWHSKLNPSGNNYDFEFSVFRWAMKETGAILYCVVGAFWSVMIDKDASPSEIEEYSKYGINHPKLKPHRFEAYMVICGDKNRTISATFDVRRDRKGKMRKLIRNDEEAIDFTGGRFVNLLVERAETEELR